MSNEKTYMHGYNAAMRSVLGFAIKELGYENVTLESALTQLADTRIALRSVCAEFGDNDWPDELHLADVIEKHLARHLR